VNCRDAKTAALDAESDCAVFFSEAVKLEHRDGARNAVASPETALKPLGAQCGEIASVDRVSPSACI
jgi:hypothetical protein